MVFILLAGQCVGSGQLHLAKLVTRCFLTGDLEGVENYARRVLQGATRGQLVEWMQASEEYRGLQVRRMRGKGVLVGGWARWECQVSMKLCQRIIGIPNMI